MIAAQEELPTLALHRQGGQYLVFANRMAWLTVISGMLTLVAGGLGLTLVPDIASYAAFGAVLPLFFGFLATSGFDALFASASSRVSEPR